MTIQLVDVCKYFDGIPHQVTALNYLQGAIPAPVLEKFAELWRQAQEAEGADEEKPEPAKPRGAIKLPGFASTFYLNQNIIAGGNFTWGEATHNGTRIPANQQIVERIMKMAGAMEEIRKKLGGKPITVTSWYRDPATNRRVGGASQSQHLSGGAVDFIVSGMRPWDVYHILDPWWGDRGGLAAVDEPGRSFVHVDDRGYRSRWKY